MATAAQAERRRENAALIEELKAAGDIDVEVLADAFAPRRKPPPAAAGDIDIETLADAFAPRRQPVTPPPAAPGAAVLSPSGGVPVLPSAGGVTLPAAAPGVAPPSGAGAAAALVERLGDATRYELKPKPAPRVAAAKRQSLPKLPNVAPYHFPKTAPEMAYYQAQEELSNLPPALAAPGYHRAETGPVRDIETRRRAALAQTMREMPGIGWDLSNERDKIAEERERLEDALARSGGKLTTALSQRLAAHQGKIAGLQQRVEELKGLRRRWYSEANAQTMGGPAGRVVRQKFVPFHGGNRLPGEPEPLSQAPVGPLRFLAPSTQAAAEYLPAATGLVQWEGLLNPLPPSPYPGAAGLQRGIREKEQALRLIRTLGPALRDDGTFDPEFAKAAAAGQFVRTPGQVATIGGKQVQARGDIGLLTPGAVRAVRHLTPYQRQLIPHLRQNLQGEALAAELAGLSRAMDTDLASLAAGEGAGVLVTRLLSSPATRALVKRYAPRLFAYYAGRAAPTLREQFSPLLSRAALSGLAVRTAPHVAISSVSGGAASSLTAAGVTLAQGGTIPEAAEAGRRAFLPGAAVGGITSLLLRGLGAGLRSGWDPEQSPRLIARLAEEAQSKGLPAERVPAFRDAVTRAVQAPTATRGRILREIASEFGAEVGYQPRGRAEGGGRRAKRGRPEYIPPEEPQPAQPPPGPRVRTAAGEEIALRETAPETLRDVAESGDAQAAPAARAWLDRHEAYEVQQSVPPPTGAAAARAWLASDERKQMDAITSAAAQNPEMAPLLAQAGEQLAGDWRYNWGRANTPDSVVEPTVAPPQVSAWRQLTPEQRAALPAPVRRVLLTQDLANSLQVMEPTQGPATSRAEMRDRVGTFRNEAELARYADDLFQGAEMKLSREFPLPEPLPEPLPTALPEPLPTALPEPLPTPAAPVEAVPLPAPAEAPVPTPPAAEVPAPAPVAPVAAPEAAAPAPMPEITEPPALAVSEAPAPAPVEAPPPQPKPAPRKKVAAAAPAKNANALPEGVRPSKKSDLKVGNQFVGAHGGSEAIEIVGLREIKTPSGKTSHIAAEVRTIRQGRGVDPVGSRHEMHAENLLRNFDRSTKTVEPESGAKGGEVSPALVVPRRPPAPTPKLEEHIAWERIEKAGPVDALFQPGEELPAVRNFIRSVGVQYRAAYDLLADAALVKQERDAVRRFGFTTVRDGPNEILGLNMKQENPALDWAEDLGLPTQQPRDTYAILVNPFHVMAAGSNVYRPRVEVEYGFPEDAARVTVLTMVHEMAHLRSRQEGEPLWKIMDFMLGQIGDERYQKAIAMIRRAITEGGPDDYSAEYRAGRAEYLEAVRKGGGVGAVGPSTRLARAGPPPEGGRPGGVPGRGGGARPDRGVGQRLAPEEQQRAGPEPLPRWLTRLGKKGAAAQRAKELTRKFQLEQRAKAAKERAREKRFAQIGRAGAVEQRRQATLPVPITGTQAVAAPEPPRAGVPRAEKRGGGKPPPPPSERPQALGGTAEPPPPAGLPGPRSFGGYSDPTTSGLLDRHRAVPTKEKPTEWLLSRLQRLANIATREFEHLPNDPRLYEFRDMLRQIVRAGRDIARDEAIFNLAYSLDGLSPIEARVVGDNLFLHGMEEDIENQLQAHLDEGKPRETFEPLLPIDANTGEEWTPARLAQALLENEEDVAGNPKVMDAVTKLFIARGEVWNGYWDEHEAVQGGGRPEAKRSYFHHKVLLYQNALGLAGEGRLGPRARMLLNSATNFGFLRPRTGSRLMYDTDLITSEMDWMPDMVLGRMKLGLLRHVQEKLDISTRLALEALDLNDDLLMPYLDEVERIFAKEYAAADAGWRERQRVAVKLTRLAGEGRLPDAPNGRWAEFLRALTSSHQIHMDREANGFARRLDLDRETLDQVPEYVTWLKGSGRAAGVMERHNAKSRAERKRRLGKEFVEPEDLVPEGYREWRGAPGTILDDAWSAPQQLAAAIEAAGAEELGIAPEVLAAVRRMVTNRRPLIIPKEAADTLDAVMEREPDSPEAFIARGLQWLQGQWKATKLIFPTRAANYFLHNQASDIENFVRATGGDPRVALRYVPSSFKMLADVMVLRRTPEDVVRLFFRQGASANIQTAAEEMGTGMGLDILGRYTMRRVHPALRTWAVMKNVARTPHDLRELTNRLALFRYYHDYILEHAVVPNYGASNEAEIDALTDPVRKAWNLSNDALVSYDRTTTGGRWLARYVYPFWRWKEGNARVQFGFARNVGANARLEAAVGRKAAGRPIGVVRAIQLGRYLLLAAHGLGLAWSANRLREMARKADERLGEDQRHRPHVVLSYHPKTGKAITWDRFSAASEFAGNWGLDNVGGYLESINNGWMTPGEAALEIGVKNPANTFLSGLGPHWKFLTNVTGQQLFPNVFEPSRVKDRVEAAFDEFGLGFAWRAYKDRPQKRGTWAKMALGANVIDVGEAAYYEMRGRAQDTLAKAGKPMDFGGKTSTEKSSAAYWFRQAHRFDDDDAAETYLFFYGKAGGDDAGMTASLKNLEPLAGMDAVEREGFIAKLKTDDQRRLKDAYYHWASLTAPNYDVSEIQEPNLGDFVRQMRLTLNGFGKAPGAIEAYVRELMDRQREAHPELEEMRQQQMEREIERRVMQKAGG